MNLLRAIVLLITFAPATAAHAQGTSRTRCFRIGTETRCETQTDNHYAPTGQQYQLPKATACWRVGNEFRCETR